MEDFNINNLVRENIKTMQPYSSARDEYKELKADMVFLDANENPFNTGVNRYPDPQQCVVKQALSSIKKIDTNSILLGNGSDEVLDLIFRAFSEPNHDNIITLPPTYGMYKVLANLNAVENIEVPLNSEFQPEVNRILDAVTTQTKILFLCSPNNPTANSFNAGLIEELLCKFKGIVVIDEAYIDFSEDESWVGKLSDFPNLIITQTLSKAYGMAGIRLGVCHASAEIISILNRIKPPYNVNKLTQKKALKRLANLNEVNNEIAYILKQRDWLISKLKDIVYVKKIYPTNANFILIKVDDANLRYQELLKNGIVIRNRTQQLGCENCLRLKIGRAHV